MKELTWEDRQAPLTDEQILGAELLLGVTFPEDYKACVKLNHGCQALESEYSLEVNGSTFDGGHGWGMILGLDPRNPESILGDLRWHPQGIVPISLDGGGNRICLDYRRSEVPTLVYYDTHLDEEDNYLPLCATFSQLVEACFIPEDVIVWRRKEGLYLPPYVED